MKTEDLIKVQTLSKKFVSQIVAVEPEPGADKLWGRLMAALKVGHATRVGWFKRDYDRVELFNSRGNGVYFNSPFLYVVKWEEQLFIIPAPDGWSAEKQDAGPQLFI